MPLRKNTDGAKHPHDFSECVCMPLNSVHIIAEYVKRYASEEALREHDAVSSSSESSMSDFSENEVDDMEL